VKTIHDVTKMAAGCTKKTAGIIIACSARDVSTKLAH
jgi:hypothetical protein